MRHVSTDAGERLHRPASLLDWRRLEAGYRGGRYRIHLIEPRKWQVTYRNVHVAFDPSLQESFRIAERHYREVLRTRDVVLWSSLLAASVVVGVALPPTAGRYPLLWLAVLAGALFVGISSLVRLVAALSRNPQDPYRRRMPWERRRHWWDRYRRGA